MNYNNYYRPSFTVHSFTNIVKWLFIANVAVYILQKMAVTVFGENYYYVFGLVPGYVLGKLCIWQLVTYMFLHGSLPHLLVDRKSVV